LQDLPFLLETRISELGGLYQKSEPFKVRPCQGSDRTFFKFNHIALQQKVVVFDKLLTAQNPGSAKAFGTSILNFLKI